MTGDRLPTRLSPRPGKLHAGGGKKGTGKLSPKRIEKNKQYVEALELRMNGMGFREIGETVGCSTSTAAERVEKAVNLIAAPSVEAYRAIEGERLNKAMSETMRILNGDILDDTRLHDVETTTSQAVAIIQNNLDLKLKAVNTLVKVSERISKLYGLDAPVKTTTDLRGHGTIQLIIPEHLYPQAMIQTDQIIEGTVVD